MEVTVTQWNEAENEAEEMGLQRRRVLQRSSTNRSGSSSNNDTEVEGGVLEFNESETKEKSDIIRTEVIAEMILQHEDTENTAILPASDLPPPEGSTSLKNVTSDIVIVDTMNENNQERQELYLERVFQIPPSHRFYCPNCKSCIQKVYIQKDQWEQISAPTQSLQPTEQIRCSSCFSFLVPIGSWLFPGLVSDKDALKDQGPEQKLEGASLFKTPKPDQSEEQMNQSKAKDATKLVIKIEDDKVVPEVENNIKKSENLSSQFIATLEDQGKGQIAPKKKYFWSNWRVIGDAYDTYIPEEPKTVSSKVSDWKVITATSQATITKQPEIEHVEVQVDEDDTGPTEEVVVPDESAPLVMPSAPTVAASSKTLEILKSIVYGGLHESLASLSVVISSASADATTLNIVALAMANLIGGLFVIGHNLKELKSEQPKRAESDTDTVVDQYNEVLGQRENFILHAFIAILSFIVFGLVPPLVYGLTFRVSDDKDFKLAAVAGAFLFCIILLSIAKAYVKRPNSYLTYIQTVLYYVSTGAVASVLSYIAGDLVKKLIAKLGWFNSTSHFALKSPGIVVQQPRWRSN